MNTAVLVLVLGSAVGHAAWNLLTRGQTDRAAFLLRSLIIVIVLGAVAVTAGEFFGDVFSRLTPTAWLCVGLAGLFGGLHYFFLAHSYDSADFTTVYPVVRALPIVLIAFGDAFRGREPTPLGWVGIMVVVAGCALSSMRSLRSIAWSHYFNRSSIWMALAALGIVGYTIPDKIAAENMTPSGLASAVIYQYLALLGCLIVFVAARMLLPMRVHGSSRLVGTGRVSEALGVSGVHRPVGWFKPAMAAALNFGSYGLILWAYQMVGRAGYVLAMRQFSIVIGVILAFAIFKESGRIVRIAGAVLVTIGVIIIKCGG